MYRSRKNDNHAVEAEQWDGSEDSYNKIQELNLHGYTDIEAEDLDDTLKIPTPEGIKEAVPGDYVISWQGDLFRSDPNTFEELFRRDE